MMKIIGMNEALVPKSLSGEKTSTIRLFDDKDLRVGDRVIFQNTQTREPFAVAEIVGIVEKPLKEISDADLEGHERYGSVDAMVAKFRSWYGDRVVPETVAKIVRFRVEG